MSQFISKIFLFFRIVGYNLHLFYAYWQRTRKPLPPPSLFLTTTSTPQTILIIGASFAGHHTARTLATNLPRDPPHRILLLEPNTHFQFTWVLPRFCILPGHEEKAFIPYGRYVREDARASVTVVHDRVVAVDVVGRKVTGAGGAVYAYDYLVIASGGGAGKGLPSRVGAERKLDGVGLLRDMQRRVKEARQIVVVGGGAAGVEVAADAKELYKEKKVTLVHSRYGLMNRFPDGLGQVALKALTELGVNVILEDRLLSKDTTNQTVTLQSGKVLPCDLLLDCAGTNPTTTFLPKDFSPAVPPSGRIHVLPTMQIADPAHPNIYACGDVAECLLRNTNSRTAIKQAEMVADNIALVMQGKEQVEYQPHWADGMIKLTLGLSKSVTHFSDGKTELMFHSNDKELTLHVDRIWWHLGYSKIDEDADYETQKAEQAKAEAAEAV